MTFEPDGSAPEEMSPKRFTEAVRLALRAGDRGGEEDITRLNDFMLQHPEGRRVVARVMALRAQLHWRLSDATAREAPPRMSPPPLEGKRRSSRAWERLRWAPVALALIVLCAWMFGRPGSVGTIRYGYSAATANFDSRLVRSIGMGETIDLPAGLAWIHLRNGVVLTAFGPGRLTVESPDHVRVDRGSLSTFVPPGAHGFRLQVPHGQLIDLGAQFSTTVHEDDLTDAHVHAGRVAVEMFESPGEDIVLSAGESVRLAAGGRLPLQHEQRLYSWAADYHSLLQASDPAVLWSFDGAGGNQVLNRAGIQAHLTRFGAVRWTSDAAGPAAEFVGFKAETILFMNQPVRAFSEKSFSLELGVRPVVDRHMTLLACKHRDGRQRPPKDSLLVEFAPRGVTGFSRSPANSLRVVCRDEPGRTGPVSLFSDRDILLDRWTHVVVVKDGVRLQIWLDGVLAGEASDAPLLLQVADYLIVGELVGSQDYNIGTSLRRPFEGQLRECAIYERALQPFEVAEHAAWFHAAASTAAVQNSSASSPAEDAAHPGFVEQH